MIADRDMTEKQLDHVLFARKDGLAAQTGWDLSYHVLRAKGSQAGFPDRVLVRDRVLYIETKSQAGKPTEEQVKWLTGLARAGSEVYLVRPSDMEEISRVFARRWSWKPWTLTYHRRDDPNETWQPDCLWLPSGYRKDEAR